MIFEYEKFSIDNPAGVDRYVEEWYTWLQSMAADSPVRRKISKIIYWFRLFKHHPKVLWGTMYYLFKLKGLFKLLKGKLKWNH